MLKLRVQLRLSYPQSNAWSQLPLLLPLPGHNPALTELGKQLLRDKDHAAEGLRMLDLGAAGGDPEAHRVLFQFHSSGTVPNMSKALVGSNKPCYSQIFCRPSDMICRGRDTWNGLPPTRSRIHTSA